MTSRDGTFFRNLASSTRNALTSRISPSAALAQVNALRAVGAVAPTTDAAPIAPIAPSNTGSTMRGGGLQFNLPDLSALGQFNQNNPPEITFTPATEASLAGLTAEGLQGPTQDEINNSERLFGIMEQQLINLSNQRDAAIAAGQADVAAAYNDQIAQLNDAKAKLATGRAAVNTQYGGLQDSLRAQADQLAASQIRETGTDVNAEVEEVSSFYDQGSESLNQMLTLIGADSPVLQQQLGADLAEFGEMAEARLRDDLESQARVGRAGQLFATKAAEAMVAETRVDAEQGRKEIENQINVMIDNIVGQINQLEDDKAGALQKVRDQVGEFDISWLDDRDAVWDVYSNEWFKGQDMTFEEEAEARQLFEDAWFGLPTDQRTREGMTEWARQNMIDINLGLLMDKVGVSDQGGLEAAIKQWKINSGTLSLIDAETYDATADINNLIRIAEQGDALTNTLQNLFGLDVTDIDFVGLEDYQPLLDLASVRSDFVNGGYDAFVAEQKAQFSGSGVSPSAVNGATLSRSDMTRVTSPSGSTGYLHPGAAGSFEQMVQAAAADGINLSFSDTYRDYATQLRAYQNFLATGENLAGNKVPNIAHPDKSNHPRGLAIDFNTGGGALAWLQENASKYGWGPISNEDWHWEYRGDLGEFSTVGSTFGGGPATTTTTTTTGTTPSGTGGGGGGGEVAL